jgi:hypothetical protein
LYECFKFLISLYLDHKQSHDGDSDNDEDEIIDGEKETIIFDQSLPSSHTVSAKHIKLYNILFVIYTTFTVTVFIRLPSMN